VLPGHLTTEQIQRPARRDAPPARACQPPGDLPRVPGVPGRSSPTSVPPGGTSSSAMVLFLPARPQRAPAPRHSGRSAVRDFTGEAVASASGALNDVPFVLVGTSAPLPARRNVRKLPADSPSGGAVRR
jgi:hypothetical protein